MSDLHMYELEDIAWDELDQIGDHLVPHRSNEHGNVPSYQEDNCKKHQHEMIGKSLKNNSWSQDVEGVIPDSCDSGFSGETTVLSDIRVPGQCLNSSEIDTMDAEFRGDDAKADERCAVNNTNSCAYSLGDMSPTENDLSFLDNDRENNESADLFYYGWPDINNFGDFDSMLRSCDSTFGFGGSNHDDMAWLSSDIESNLVPFESVPEQDLSNLNNMNDDMANDSNVGSSSISYRSGFQGSESGKAHPLGDMTFMSESAVSDRNTKDQQKKQATCPNISEGKRKDRCKSRQVLAPPNDQKQTNNVTPNSFGYLQTPTPYMHMSYVYAPNQISVDSQLTCLNSEMNSLIPVSPKESSFSHPFSGMRQGFHHYSVSKQFHQSRNDVENHSGVERNNITNPANRDSSSSCMSSGFDEISLEASSFCQLKQVVEQLDITTKSCIRDSLYRLARSAEQKHKYAYIKGGGQQDRESGDAFMDDGSNNGLTDMETATNPVDRSVAHLLFHRPSDSSTLPAHVDSSLKSHTMIHGSNTSLPVLVGQLVSEEEGASETEKKVPITGDG